MSITKITVKSNGVLQFKNGDIPIVQMLPYVEIRPLKNQLGVRVFDAYGNFVDVFAKVLLFTELEPAPPVAFSSSIIDLWEFIARYATIGYNDIASAVINDSTVSGATVKDALEYLAGGGGTAVLDENITVYGVYNVASTVTNKKLTATANSTVNMPLISPSLYTLEYKVMANNNTVTVAANIADDIIGNSFVTLRKWDSITLTCTTPNRWLIL